MSVRDKLYHMIALHLKVAPEKITSDSSFSDDLHADSDTVRSLAKAVAREFRIKIGPEELECLEAVEDLHACVDVKLSFLA